MNGADDRLLNSICKVCLATWAPMKALSNQVFIMHAPFCLLDRLLQDILPIDFLVYARYSKVNTG